jgi:hypothetical protein
MITTHVNEHGNVVIEIEFNEYVAKITTLKQHMYFLIHQLKSLKHHYPGNIIGIMNVYLLHNPIVLEHEFKNYE